MGSPKPRWKQPSAISPMTSAPEHTVNAISASDQDAAARGVSGISKMVDHHREFALSAAQRKR